MSAAANPVELELGIIPSVPTGQICQGCGSPFRVCTQLWSCLKCGRVRIWGWMHPADRAALPLLNCECCEMPTRHGFVAIAGYGAQAVHHV